MSSLLTCMRKQLRCRYGEGLWSLEQPEILKLEREADNMRSVRGHTHAESVTLSLGLTALVLNFD